MLIEIWSDFMCPFCYIGKRKFEKALAQFPRKDEVEIVWKSFQLDPNIPVAIPEAERPNIHQYLANLKHMSYAQAEASHVRVTAWAKDVGLDYRFDRTVVANSFDAHRLSHLAKQHGVQTAIEEALFYAYFTEGKNLGDPQTLATIGETAGIDYMETKAMLSSELYVHEVRSDIDEARRLGIHGVPCFVFDRKSAVSGAQDPQVFLGAMKEVWEK